VGTKILGVDFMVRWDVHYGMEEGKYIAQGG